MALTLKLLNKDKTLSEEQMNESFVLGWCVELVRILNIKSLSKSTIKPHSRRIVNIPNICLLCKFSLLRDPKIEPMTKGLLLLQTS